MKRHSRPAPMRQNPLAECECGSSCIQWIANANIASVALDPQSARISATTTTTTTTTTTIIIICLLLSLLRWTHRVRASLESVPRLRCHMRASTSDLCARGMMCIGARVRQHERATSLPAQKRADARTIHNRMIMNTKHSNCNNNTNNINNNSNNDNNDNDKRNIDN